MKWSLYLGKVSGIRIVDSLVVQSASSSAGFHPILQQAQRNQRAIMGSFLYCPCLFVTLHELGHALTGQRFNIVTKNITLLPIGGVYLNGKAAPEKPLQELWVAIAEL
ncbi:MAG: hypothetical protein R2788_19490 [Saprospiraceae bacterium]